MHHCNASRRNKGGRLCAVKSVAAALALAATSAGALAAERSLALVFIVNGVETAEPILTIERDGRLSADAAALRAAGIDLPAVATGAIALDSIAGAETQLDEGGQRLIVSQRRRATGRNRIGLARETKPRPLNPSRNGLALAYDLTAIVGEDRNPAIAGFIETRLFMGGAALSHGTVLAPRYNGGSRAIRLDTALSLSDPDTLFRATIGDLVGSSLPWSRAVRLAGIQMGSDFGLRPDLVTFPLPAIAGEAALPSTIDLIAQSGRTISRTKVEPGDYLLSGVPVPTGHGTLGIVVRDASGRQQMHSISLYGAPQLLAPGLSDFSFDMGAVRRSYGRRSADYGRFAASVSGRRGMSDKLTLEGHAEVAEGLALGGIGAVIGVGTFGVLSANAGVSTARAAGEAADGYQFGLAFERVARPLSFSLAGRYVSDGYRDVAAVSGDPPPRSTIAAQAGLDLEDAGTISVGYTRLFARTYADRRRGDALSLATASYSVHLGAGLNLFASGLADLNSGDGGGTRSLSLGLSMALGGGRSTLAGLDVRPGVNGQALEYRDPAWSQGDAGYRLAVNRGAVERIVAEGEYRAPIGRLSGAVQRIGGRNSLRLGMRGAVLLVDEGIFLADSLAGGFAIVSTGAPGVMVLQDHREVGRTRGDGRYLLTNLRAFQDNLVAIDPLDLPPDARTTAAKMVVRPGMAGPVEARFAIDRRPAALVKLTDGAGAELPAGTEAALNGATAIPIGYGGLAWLEGLTRDNIIAVALPDGKSCTARIMLGKDAPPPRIGPVQCLTAAERF